MFDNSKLIIVVRKGVFLHELLNVKIEVINYLNKQ